jgi:hypothetical protein
VEELDLNKWTADSDGSQPRPPSYPLSADPFIRGPFPLEWVAKIRTVSGYRVAMALWYLCGLKKCLTVKLSSIACKKLNIDRQGKYRGLKELEGKGLIRVARDHGKNPVVTIKGVKKGVSKQYARKYKRRYQNEH